MLQDCTQILWQIARTHLIKEQIMKLQTVACFDKRLLSVGQDRHRCPELTQKVENSPKAQNLKSVKRSDHEESWDLC